MWALLPLTILVIGFPHLKSTFVIDLDKEEEKEHLKILSYNVRVFNVYDHLRKADPEAPRKMLEWIFEQEADIVCLQEFYNDDNSDLFNIKEKFKNHGYNYSVSSMRLRNKLGAQFGVAIFSKLPSVGENEIVINEESHNRGAYMDIKYNNDTIRVYNVHLHSMKLEVEELINEESEKQLARNLHQTLASMKRGFVERAGEVQQIKSHARSAPHQHIIICGDFNDLPYSYAYTYFRESFKNAFEEEGAGFGFTFNANPKFIRIDNQFFDASFQAKAFKVHNNILYSDHYPISGRYTLKHN